LCDETHYVVPLTVNPEIVHCRREPELSATTGADGHFLIPIGEYYIYFDVPAALKDGLQDFSLCVAPSGWQSFDDLPDGDLRWSCLHRETLGLTVIVETGQTTPYVVVRP